MSDAKKEITLMQAAPWIAVAVIGYMLWTKQDVAPAPEPKPVSVTIEKATAGVFAKQREDSKLLWNQAADRLERGEIKTDKELFAIIQPATIELRGLANKPFDLAFEMTLPRNEDGTFTGKEIEASKVLRRVAKSW